MEYEDLNVDVQDYVATVEICRPPNNFFDTKLIKNLADCFSECDQSADVRAILLCADGKHFCAGNDFSKSDPELRGLKEGQENPLYAAAAKMFATATPIVGAIQGAAIGGGFGLALVPDFRVACEKSRFSANFVKLGFYPGFGLTHTLPRLIGTQNASRLLMTGQRIDGATALNMGLVDKLTSEEGLRSEAHAFALEIAGNAPLSVQAVKKTMREGLAEAVKAQTKIENEHQNRLGKTSDFKEGIRSVAERRPGEFTGT